MDSRAGRRSKLLAAAIGLAIAALQVACAKPPPAELAFVVRQPVGLEPKILRQEVTGEWCFTQDVITVSLRPPWRVRLAELQPAVTRAIESVPGANVLVDVSVRTRVEQYLLFQRTCSIVVGDAGRLE